MPCVARHMPGQGSERGLVTYSASLSYDVINDRYATPSPTPCGRRSRLKPQRPGRRGGPPHLRRAEGHGPAPLPPRRRQRDRRPRRRSHHRRAGATAKATPTCASARPCAAVPGATPPGGPPRAGPRAPRPTARWPRGRVCARRHQEDGRGEAAPPYHARDRVERVFEIARRGGKALPVCVQTEETLGGRLPVCLVVTAAARMMSDVLASRRTSPAVESMPGVPRERHATGRDGRLVTTEPVRKTSEAHGAFGIRCPDTIRLPVVSQGSAGNSGLLRAGREPWRPQQRSARHSRAGPHQEGVHLHRPAREKLTSGEGVAGQAVPAVL